MTATTAPTGFGSRSSNALIKAALVVAVLIMIAVAAFAMGRTSADTNTSIAPITFTQPSTDVCDPLPHTHVC